MRKERGGFHGIITKVDQSALIGLHGKQVKKKPTVGLSLKPKLAQPCLGSTQLTVASFSSPSSHEMGEPSAKASLTPLAHSVITAEALSDKPKSPMLTEVVADRQASDGCSA